MKKSIKLTLLIVFAVVLCACGIVCATDSTIISDTFNTNTINNNVSSDFNNTTNSIPVTSNNIFNSTVSDNTIGNAITNSFVTNSTITDPYANTTINTTMDPGITNSLNNDIDNTQQLESSTTGVQDTSISYQDDSSLTPATIINIIMIVVGIVIILLGFAILIRLNK